jgi:glyoxylase I family protein
LQETKRREDFSRRFCFQLMEGCMGIELSGCCPLLQVFDMPTAVGFYCDGLGFEVVSHSGALSGAAGDFNWVLLDRKGTQLMLNTAYDEGERPEKPDRARVAAHGDTCIYFGWEDLDGLYSELRAKGLNAREPKVAPYGMKQLYVTDPDGFGLCFQWPVTQQSYDQWVEWYGLEEKRV